MDLKVSVTSEQYEELVIAHRQSGTIMTHDEKLASEGYLSVVIGMCPPGLWGHTITFVMEIE